jgi:quinol monooxygenase YgiN
MILLILHISIPEDRREAVLRELAMLAAPARAQKGCYGCRTFLDVDNEEFVTYMEEWESFAALRAHLRSSQFRMILETMELAGIAPILRILEVDRTLGRETVERIWYESDEIEDPEDAESPPAGSRAPASDRRGAGDAPPRPHSGGNGSYDLLDHSPDRIGHVAEAGRPVTSSRLEGHGEGRDDA